MNDCQVEANPGQQPEHLDFPLDDKEQKKVARVMLKMVIDINGKYLPETGRTFTARTRVTCETYHHGAPKPRTLAAELMGALEATTCVLDIPPDITPAVYHAMPHALSATHLREFP